MSASDMIILNDEQFHVPKLPGPSPPETPSFTNCVALSTTLIRYICFFHCCKFLTIVRNTINTTTFTRAS
ncbi:hypothetical protein MKW98_029700 [Papaver atlanticum]|uniref:Uncharacterized protein n=1 Tax=Papaver atlanticum TaxID=357466 RepID=A0AAD4XSJ0_9MAGN|nr:hypothetical protein MKW98_029700 [Papaver atlanticum]